jgi:hypothetical protein
LRLVKGSRLLTVVSLLPAILAIAAGLYMARELLQQNELRVVLRAWSSFVALALGVVVPRFRVRFICALLMAFTFVSGFSIGAFYIPATLAAIVATVAEAVKARPAIDSHNL